MTQEFLNFSTNASLPLLWNLMSTQVINPSQYVLKVGIGHLQHLLGAEHVPFYTQTCFCKFQEILNLDEVHERWNRDQYL
jgi:hypothetical protein